MSSAEMGPSVAARVRRARFLASRSRTSRATSCSAISTALRRLLVAWASHAASVSREARMPIRRRASMMSSLIVASEIVRNDVAVFHVIAKDDGQRDGTTKSLSMLIAHDGEGARIVAASSCHLSNGRGQDVGTVEVEKLQSSGGHASDVAARFYP